MKSLHHSLLVVLTSLLATQVVAQDDSYNLVPRNGRIVDGTGNPWFIGDVAVRIVGGVEGWYNHYTAVGRDWSRMLVSGNNCFAGLTMDQVMSLRTQDKSTHNRLSIEPPTLIRFTTTKGSST